MMIRHFATKGLLLSLMMLPVQSYAYVTPEEVLNDTTYTTRFYEAPPSIRTTQDRLLEQQRISAERREAALAAIKPQPEAENLHGAAPTEPAQTDIDKMIELVKLLQTSSSATNTSPADASAETTEDPVTERLLQRVEANKIAIDRQSFLQGLLGDNEETLHSGAPLAESGPATVIVTMLAMGAIVETLRRVKKKEVVG